MSDNEEIKEEEIKIRSGRQILLDDDKSPLKNADQRVKELFNFVEEN